MNEAFGKAAVNICLKSLPGTNAWRDWEGTFFCDSAGDAHFFPGQGEVDASGEGELLRLRFLYGYFEYLLRSRDMARAGFGMLPDYRADLTKYLGVVVDRTLRQMVDAVNCEKDGKTPFFAYRLPVDGERLAADLYVFHRRVNGAQANIAQYRSLNQISEAVGPYRFKHPLSREDRLAAHAEFLITDTPEELMALLPEGWRVTASRVAAPDGRSWKRKKGALLLGRLSDGTEVVKVLSERASRAYGSPRWCTAYRHRRTEFDAYKDNLLTVMDGDGERWQINFDMDKISDSNDKSCDLLGVTTAHPGLQQILAPNYLFAGEADRACDKAFKGAFDDPAFCDAFLKGRSAEEKNEIFLRAASFGFEPLIDRLLETSFDEIDFSEVTFVGMSAIDLASRQGHAGIVRKVLPYCSQEVLEGGDLYGNNLLTVPALKGYLDVVRDLVVACPKLLVALDDHGNDAIMKAASSGKDDVLRYLLPIAASDGLERMNDFDRNAIMLAVRRGSAEAVRELVPFCSDAAINAVNGEGDTALMQALKGDLYVRRASDELFFELLKHPGHDLSLTTRSGQTLEELAEQADRPVVVLALKKYREEHPSEAVAKSASRPGRFVPRGPSF